MDHKLAVAPDALGQRLHRLAVERVFVDVGGFDHLGRARARNQVAVRPGRMPHADMAERVDDAFVRHHPVGDRKIVLGLCEIVGHDHSSYSMAIHAAPSEAKGAPHGGCASKRSISSLCSSVTSISSMPRTRRSLRKGLISKNVAVSSGAVTKLIGQIDGDLRAGAVAAVAARVSRMTAFGQNDHQNSVLEAVDMEYLAETRTDQGPQPIVHHREGRALREEPHPKSLSVTRIFASR